MPEETPVAQPAPEKPSLAAEYDIGSLEKDPSSSPVVSAPESAEVPSPPPTSPTRERNPDGTFKPTKSKHSPLIVRQAKQLGFSDEDIAESAPEDLRASVQTMAIELALKGRAETLERAASKPTEAPVEEPLGIDEGQYDEGLMKVIKSQAQQLKALEARLSKTEGFLNNQANISNTQRLDMAFQKHKDVFGEQSHTDFSSAEDPMFQRRMAAVKLIDGMKTGTLDQKVAKAREILYGSAKPADKPTDEPKPRYSPEEFASGGLARPTHRAGSTEPAGEEKAIAGVRQWQRDNGHTASQDEKFPG